MKSIKNIQPEGNRSERYLKNILILATQRVQSGECGEPTIRALVVCGTLHRLIEEDLKDVSI